MTEQRRWSRTAALLDLVHPGPSLATVAVAVALMAGLARGRLPVQPALLVGAMVLFQQAAISLHNDWCDRELDAAAKPWRAIPSGLVSPAVVLAVCAALSVLSFALSLPIGKAEVALNATALAAGCAYNASLKRTILSWAPFAVAFPLLPLFGAVALPSLDLTWQHVALAYAGIGPIAVAIHLLDSYPDLVADQVQGVRGLGHALGPRRSRYLAAALAACGAALLAGGAVLVGLPQAR